MTATFELEALCGLRWLSARGEFVGAVRNAYDEAEQARVVVLRLDDVLYWLQEWLGWEIAVARQIGAWRAWSRHNASYYMGDEYGGDWGNLSAKQRSAIVVDRLAYAKKIGVIDAGGTPRSIR